MSKFQDFYKNLPHPVQMSSEREQLKMVWNKALDQVRDSLSGKMRTDYGLTIGSKQVVDWKHVENVIDDLKTDG